MTSIVVVTGAASGIGEAVCVDLAGRGHVQFVRRLANGSFDSASDPRGDGLRQAA
jgi:NAD(P)-dependent dehydrogenase (short-subunit alcohol dehydrogenase family)